MLRDGAANVTLSVGMMNQACSPSPTASPSSGLADANASEPKLHSILCSRTSAWASRIYETSGSEGNSMQRAELALRQALQALPLGNDGDDGDSARNGAVAAAGGEATSNGMGAGTMGGPSPDASGASGEYRTAALDAAEAGMLAERAEAAAEASVSGGIGQVWDGADADARLHRLEGGGGGRSAAVPGGSFDGGTITGSQGNISALRVGTAATTTATASQLGEAGTAPSASSFGNGALQEEKATHISWKCGVCGYHVLAMDQNGHPLPLSRGAYGELLPIRCPQCEMEHTSWEQAIPFDKHGDHVNIRSTLSNNYVTQSRKPEKPSASLPPVVSSVGPTSPLSGAGAGVGSIHHAPPPAKRELPPILANIGRVTYRDGVPVPNHMKTRQSPDVRMAFYCSLCGRRLLRVDSEGELVAMDRDARGEVLPIRCPGCGEVHNKWVVKPFTVGRLRVSGDATRLQETSGQGKERCQTGTAAVAKAAGSCVEPLPTW